MKIVLGIDGNDTPESIQAYCDEGADEFFAGYVPRQWINTFGWEVSPNRRPFGPESQYTSLSDLRAVRQVARRNNARLAVTLNAHQYCDVQLPALETLLRDLESIEPDAYIVADPALMLQLREWGVSRPLHLSIGAGCYNSQAIRFFLSIGRITRVVCPRQMSYSEMHDMINASQDATVEFEAMVIGYRCHFNDEYCFTWHSLSTENFCAMFTDAQTRTVPHYPSDWKTVVAQSIDNPDEQMKENSDLDRFVKTCLGREERGIRSLTPPLSMNHGPGLSAAIAQKKVQNCGLCAIPRLRDIGVRYLKIPSRGEASLKRHYLKMVRTMRDTPNAGTETAKRLMNSPGFCNYPGSCYYAQGKEC